MTPEEMEARIAELESSNDSLVSKNRELLTETKKAKAKAKGADIDPVEYVQLQTQVEELSAQLESNSKMSAAELEKLTGQLTERDNALQSVLIEGGLTEALAKAKVKPEFMDAAKALLKSDAKVVSEGGRYSALLGDKPITEAVMEWALSDTGKHFASAPENNGGGAQNTSGGAFSPKGNITGDKGQRLNAIRNMFPDLE